MNVRKLRAALGGIVAVLVLGGCAAGTTAQDSDREVPVQVAEAVRSELGQTVEVVGVAKAGKEYSVYPAGAAKLAAVHVEQGDAVTEGQLLAELDNRDAALAAEMERASLEVSRNQYETAVSRMRQTELSAKETIQQAGKMDEQLEENIRQAALGVEQAGQNLKLAELRVRQAEKRLEDTRILSPGNGIVASIAALAGEMVSGQSPFAVIVSDQTLLVEASVSEEQLTLFQEGETLDIMFPSSGRERVGTVRSLPVAVGQSGLYTVELTVDNADRSIRPGVPAKILLPRTLVASALLVPTDAVIEDSEGAHVFAVKDGRAVLTPVEIIRTQTEFTAVEGDLQEGTPVVIRGQFTLSDGSRVSVVEGGR